MGKFPKGRERKMVPEVEAECEIAVAPLEMEENGRWEEGGKKRSRGYFYFQLLVYFII